MRRLVFSVYIARTAQEVLRVFLDLDDDAIINRERLIDFPRIDVPDHL